MHFARLGETSAHTQREVNVLICIGVFSAIFNQKRQDSNSRHDPTAISRDKRDSSLPSSSSDGHSPSLRTKPVEIHTRHLIAMGGVSNRDRDYRTPYEQSMASGRLFLEEHQHESWTIDALLLIRDRHSTNASLGLTDTDTIHLLLPPRWSDCLKNHCIKQH